MAYVNRVTGCCGCGGLWAEPTKPGCINLAHLRGPIVRLAWNCTKEEPWTRDKGEGVHPQRVYIGDEEGSVGSGGSYEMYRFLNCGKVEYDELPN